MKKRGPKTIEHKDGCTCEQCYKAFCADNGLKLEKRV